ncbi:MAG: UPF0182 family protein [Thermoleophilia bacterium]|jgi:uncharacterized membrane protein (UPF0182 family)
MRGPSSGMPPMGMPTKTPGQQLRGFVDWWKGASWKKRTAVLIPAVIVVLLILLVIVSRFFTEYLWFQEVDYTTVFWTRIWARLVVMVGFGVVFFGIFYGNVRLAQHFAPRLRPAGDGESEVYDLVDTRTQRGRRLFLATSIILAIIFALGYGGSWQTIWLFLQQSDFGFTAPVLGRDAAFFVFTIPVARLILIFVMLALLLSFIAVVIIYISSRAITGEGRTLRTSPHVKAHLSVIFAIAMLGKAADYLLGVWGLAYSERGATFGPSYTDVHVQIPVLRFLAIVALIAAVLFLINIYFRGWRLPIIAIGLLFVTWLFAGQIYPAIVQQYRVLPTEIQKESPYIANNIKATRWAFNLDQVESASFEANTNLDMEAVKANAATIDNVRVWDPATALRAYRQIQEIRTYYSFNDVDIDRYTVDGRYRQVLIAPREFSSADLSPQARTWVNEHLTYTHGYGVVVSPVSEAAEEGLPKLFLSDIPPRGTSSLKVTRPQIYYGEVPDSFVLVKTTAKEFDYPLGDENVFTEYEGKGGVGIGNLSRKIIFSVRFASLKLLVSDYLQSESRILYRRSIEERVQTIAPFLRYDQDPYIVLRDDGSLVWIWDAYTTTDLFPNSQPSSGGLNYIRNSIKVVVDAYNGDVTFYQMEPNDAIANTWGKIHPGLFTSADKMPEDIRRHLRYPEDLFSVQAGTLALYHMKEPQIFYNKEDVWEIPREVYGGEEIRVIPYYVMMVLPGETKEELVLLQPFSPRSKQNMISWMAARMDGDKYGELMLIDFPKEKLVFGPSQIEARITNDPVISSQITLWDQAGSNVIRGNLLVIPVEDSILYVEPLYLEAEKGAIPELTRVIAAYGDQVVMEPDLTSALEAIFSSKDGTTPTSTTSTTESGDTTATSEPSTTTTGPSATTTVPGADLPTDRKTLLDLADRLYEEARAAQRGDDWAAYGTKIKQLGEVISALRALENGAQ